jgi:hypothetical protein
LRTLIFCRYSCCKAPVPVPDLAVKNYLAVSIEALKRMEEGEA